MSGFISEREGDNATRVNSRRYVITHRMSLERPLAVESDMERESRALRNNFPNCFDNFTLVYQYGSFSKRPIAVSERYRATLCILIVAR